MGRVAVGARVGNIGSLSVTARTTGIATRVASDH